MGDRKYAELKIAGTMSQASTVNKVSSVNMASYYRFDCTSQSGFFFWVTGAGFQDFSY